MAAAESACAEAAAVSLPAIVVARACGLWLIRISRRRGGLELGPCSVFPAPLHVFSQTVSAPRTQFEKKGEVVRAPQEVLHELPFFVELLHSGVCGAVSNTHLVPNTV